MWPSSVFEFETSTMFLYDYTIFLIDKMHCWHVEESISSLSDIKQINHIQINHTFKKIECHLLHILNMLI
jgi:hypothetical protein